MPIYWCILFIWIIYKLIVVPNFPLTSVLGNIFCVEGLKGIGREFNWYISAMWIFYLITPFLYRLLKKIDSKIGLLFCSLVLVIFSMSFWNSRPLIIIASRIPIYFLGMCMAKTFSKDEKVSCKSVILYTLLMIVGFVILFMCYRYYVKYLWLCGLHWYPFILITPGLCVLISLIMYWINKLCLKINNIILLIGNNTFEIYLVHILLLDVNKTLKLISSSTILILVTMLATMVFKYYCKIVLFIFGSLLKKIKKFKQT